MEARSGTAAGGLLRDVEKTPTKEGVDDAFYLYSEESLLDYSYGSHLRKSILKKILGKFCLKS